jgi:excisionase family DNA binding protein
VTRRSAGTAASLPALPVRLLSVQEVAELLQVPVKTIYQWRHRGEGPRPMRLGKYLRFDPVDVATWIEARKACSAERQGR